MGNQKSKKLSFAIAGMALSAFMTLNACSGGGERLDTTNVDIHAKPPEGKGRIVMFRDDRLVGAGIAPIIKVDGDHYPRCKRDSVYFIELPKGDYKITAETENISTINANLTDNDVIYIGCSIHFGVFTGRIKLKLESEESALSEIKNLKYKGTYLEPVAVVDRGS